MSEYIERGALIAFVRSVRQRLQKDSKDFFTRDEMLLNFQQYVEHQPAADVVEVVHAGFVRFTDGTWHCSNCIEELLVDDDDLSPRNADYLAKHTAYCNACGAKLDKGASALINDDEIETPEQRAERHLQHIIDMPTKCKRKDGDAHV